MRKRTRGLKWVRRTIKPTFKERKTTSSQKRGLTYERKIASVLRDLYEPTCVVEYGPWFEFEDCWGHSVCQPDVLIVPSDTSQPLVLVEVKLTYKPEAEGKLRNFYKLIVSKMWPTRAVKMVQVYKNGRCPYENTDLRKLLEGEFNDGYYTCRWT